MRYRVYVYILVSALMISSCRSSGGDNFVIDFDVAPQEEVILRFEDLVEEVNVVALETRDDLILPGRVWLEVTSDYIVIVGDYEINQFDKDGNFIRKLAMRGRGPNEFGMITHVVDDKRSILYLLKYMGESDIMRIDLTTGNFLDPIRSEISFWGKGMDGRGNIVTTRDKNYYDRAINMADTLVRVYFINGESGEIKDLPVCSGDPRKEWISMRRINEVFFFYDCVNSDTLYRFTYDGVDPYKVLKVSDKIEDDMGTGNRLTLRESFGDDLLIKKELVEIGDRGYPVTASEEYILLNSEGELRSFGQVIIGKYNIKQSVAGSIPISSGDYLYFSFNAPNMILFLERALEDETTTEKQKREINALLSKIDEEDNHIIIYGKRR